MQTVSIIKVQQVKPS